MALSDIHLSRGMHLTREEGMCLLEAVAFLAGEEHSDRPVCVHPVLASYGHGLNDAIFPEREDLHDRLRSLAQRLVGTANGDGQRWGLMAADWLVRTYTPAWLRLVPELVEHAEGLERLDEITSWEDLPVQCLQAACDAASTGDVVCDAALYATRIAALNAALNAVWDATPNAALNAALYATPNSALYATRNAALNAARNAALNAARVAVLNAPLNVAQDVLRPTVHLLQESALDLFELMLAEEN